MIVLMASSSCCDFVGSNRVTRARPRRRLDAHAEKKPRSFRLRGCDVGNSGCLPATTAQRRCTPARFGKILYVASHCLCTSRQGVTKNIRARTSQVNGLARRGYGRLLATSRLPVVKKAWSTAPMLMYHESGPVPGPGIDATVV